MKKIIKIAGYQGKQSVHTSAANQFINLIENQFIVSFIQDITLHNHKASDLIKKTQINEINISYLFSSYFTNLIPELMYLDLPFYFNSKNDAFSILNKNLKNFISNELKNIHNLILLGFWDNGTRHISSSKSFINSLDDCNGQIIRTTPNKLHIETFKAFGFIPKPLDVLDFKQALLNDELDAQENPLTNYCQFKVYDTQKYLTKTSHVYGFCLFIVNKEFYDGLSPNEKKMIMKSAEKVNFFQRNLALQEEENLLKQITKKNVQISELSEESKNEFKKISKIFHNDFFKKFGLFNS